MGYCLDVAWKEIQNIDTFFIFNFSGFNFSLPPGYKMARSQNSR